MSEIWGYGVDNGPVHWAGKFPVAKDGRRQSPIEIKNAETKHDPALTELSLSYDPSSAKSLVNNGHSVQVDFDDSEERSVLSGGPIQGKYRLRQFHLHWGAHDGQGSEHVVDGEAFSAELHLVHWNADKYESFEVAAQAPDGLAVIGVFLKVSNHNPALKRLISSLDCVQEKCSRIEFNDFNPHTLLPPSLQFWTYLGSLTTPPLYESVIWIVLKDHIPISKEQIARFRTLQFTGPDHLMKDNFRPPQPLNNREVLRNFQ
ncbi:carbonic anhydrase 13-like [Leucoraja erinacea]|uniref:carbonic anhydrase 13-like n=1 Tax=Leucoraja erinaceus TaxID=7782 RepID=UPI002458AAF7|nr:carbonic anhydrase 13-like [Leucoraja erinacea]